MCKKFFAIDSRTYGFSWDGAKIITLRAIIFARRPDKTLMRWPLLVEVSDGGAGVDLDLGRTPDDVTDAGVGQQAQGAVV